MYELLIRNNKNMTILYFVFIAFFGPFNDQYSTQNQLNSEHIDILKGHWRLDLSPENNDDSNFAKMIISSVDKNSIEGIFYRDGVKIREGRLQISEGMIYVALVSGDNSGTYNTSFYLKDGMLYGTTHSLDKDFLAVWKGVKIN